MEIGVLCMIAACKVANLHHKQFIACKRDIMHWPLAAVDVGVA